MKIVVQRELIPFRELLKESYTKEVYDHAMSHVTQGKEHYYSDAFLAQRLVSRTVLWNLPQESVEEMIEGFQRLDRQCPYVIDAQLDQDCFMEFRVIGQETIPANRSLLFYNRPQENVVIYPQDSSISLNSTDLNRVISVVFNALWPLIDEDLVSEESVGAELILRFNGIEKTLYSYVSTHVACRHDLAKQYINGMNMIDKIIQKYHVSFEG